MKSTMLLGIKLDLNLTGGTLVGKLRSVHEY